MRDLDAQVKEFIIDHQDLIQENTPESWNRFYDRARADVQSYGAITEVLLEAGIDPTERLGYVPARYLRKSAIKEYHIPKGVTSIGAAAFSDCSDLVVVTIPNSVITINSFAFDGCCSLQGITIPSSVTAIGGNAFRDCSNLKGAVIGSNTTLIGIAAFEGCKSLTSAIIPDSVTSLGSYTFSDCSNLIHAVIGSGITSIGDGVFYHCGDQLVSVEFRGTWAEAEKCGLLDKMWREGSSIKKLICTDDEINF